MCNTNKELYVLSIIFVIHLSKLNRIRSKKIYVNRRRRRCKNFIKNKDGKLVDHPYERVSREG